MSSLLNQKQGARMMRGLLAVALAALMLQAARPATAKDAQGRNALRGVPKINSETAPDPEIEKAIVRALGEHSSEQEIRYYYNRVDLNSDGNFEAIVHLVGPSICGTGGCNTLILQPERGGYRLVSTITVTRTPVIVSAQRTKGWNDLIFYVSGGGITRGYYAALRFNGRAYPGNPTVLPALGPRAKIAGKAYLADEVSPGSGIVLRPARR
ncbi:MAG TPA: hypothetical protein VF735_02030 [Pyrinomonadaceae bacterium]|jgi:hypothetical protein